MSAISASAGKVPARKRRRRIPALTADDLARLGNKVYRVVCSEPWKEHCLGAILHGEVRYNLADQAKQLRRSGVYPPGGDATGMIRCRGDCRRWCPPQAIGSSGICIDCFYNSLPLELMVQIPTSPGFSTRIRDADVAAHLGTTAGADGKPTGNILRRRYLAPDGTVREPFRAEDGFDYESVFEVQGTPAAAGKAA